MKIIYHGPRDSIEIAGHGLHNRGEVRDYPTELAVELVQNSVRQRFNLVPPVQTQDGETTGQEDQEMGRPEDKKTVGANNYSPLPGKPRRKKGAT